MKTKCIIVDDEPLAIEAIEMHLNELSGFEIVAKCSDAVKAFEILNKKKIDLMFLDIQMPKITGIEFLKSLQNHPKVIITSAYSQYAVKGFELDVIDYLMKPIPFNRFIQAIDKYYRSVNENIVGEDKQGLPDDFILVRADRKNIKIKFNEILYLESMKDYVSIKTNSGTITTKILLSICEKKLPGDMFIRIHRSFIINKSKVDSFTSNTVVIGKKELPIANSYKNRVFTSLGYNKML